MPIDSRFLSSSGWEVFTGNELIVKGILETEGGVSLFTGYPGSPVAQCFDLMGSLAPLLKKHGVHAFQSNNEALASAAINGSQMAGIKAICVMKSVGVHVAADALALGNLAGVHPQGGAVIVMGDDPWCDSTQVPVDSRFISEHLRMPVIEPGDAQQLKDWVDLAFKLSQASNLYIGYLVTNFVADGGGSVVCTENHFPDVNTTKKFEIDTATIALDKLVQLPPRTWMHELEIPARHKLAVEAARKLGINRIQRSEVSGPAMAGKLQSEVAEIGFIVTGCAGAYLRQVLQGVGLDGAFPILEMGMAYPADAGLVHEFSSLCKHMIVIEERRSFLERNIRDTAAAQLPHEQATDLAGRLFGKSFPVLDGKPTEGIPETRGLNPSVLALKLLPLLQKMQSLDEEARQRVTKYVTQLRMLSTPKLEVLGAASVAADELLQKNIVRRSPTFCPGCPHRDSASVLLEIRKNFQDEAYMKKTHKLGKVDLVAHGDTGCYTMLMFPPTDSLMHNYSGMGLGAGTGSGINPFITNKQLVFMGDSTFFHSGQIAITNAIAAKQDLCFIILENGTTAMTGHQGHPGTERDLMGRKLPLQDIEQIVRGMAATSGISVLRLRPDERAEYRHTLEKAILDKGVKVIIANKECGITYHRTVLKDQRKQIKEFGYLPRQEFMNITPEVCENCLECTKQTGCPGLLPIETDFGRKIDTDVTWCVNDGACERVRVTNDLAIDVKPCPSFEKLTVVRKKRRRYTLPNMALDKLPSPKWAVNPTADRPWRVHMSGVGGMGIGLVGAILVRAGHMEGYRVLFSEKKGLAIRNGGVFSQVAFVPKSDEATESRRSENEGAETTATIPYGQADLLLGVDVLEAARAVDPREQFRIATAQRTAAVVNTYKQATIETLLGRADFNPDGLRDAIFKKCNQELSYANDLSTLCERRLGSKQFVNIMMLGVAYQLGLIPVSSHSIAWSIKDSVKRDHRRNLKAFNIGRKLALEPRKLPPRPTPATWEQLVTSKLRLIRRGRLSSKFAADFERIAHAAVRQLKNIPDQAKYDLVVRIYELVHYENIGFAKRYVDLLKDVYHRDSSSHAYAATHAAIRNLAKVLLIKDEPYVAWLLTRPEKIEHDIEKYNLDVANGDRLVYEHYTSPEIPIGPWRIRLNLHTTNWQLRLMATMKVLRKWPAWHRREKAFAKWYIELLKQADLGGDVAYRKWMQIVSCPEMVNGYREIRYPKMIAVKQHVDDLMQEKAEIRAKAAMV